MINQKAPLVEINDPLLASYGVTIFVHQLYLIHPIISGNKWFKLKYNLQEAQQLGHNTVLTFGGAFSNHIHATAAACKEFEFKCIGVIRGERNVHLNSTLAFAESCGMHLHFVDRAIYRTKHIDFFIENLKKQFGDFYLIPEGGSNTLGVKGCVEITSSLNAFSSVVDFDYVCCACGTGTTLAGVSLSLKDYQRAIGVAALKGGSFLTREVDILRDKYIALNNSFELKSNKKNFEIETAYHFGGYAKIKPELINFADRFKQLHNIPLDYVYTAKLFFGIYDLIKKNYFKKGMKIVILHSGGLQGNAGFL